MYVTAVLQSLRKVKELSITIKLLIPGRGGVSESTVDIHCFMIAVNADELSARFGGLYL